MQREKKVVLGISSCSRDFVYKTGCRLTAPDRSRRICGGDSKCESTKLNDENLIESDCIDDSEARVGDRIEWCKKEIAKWSLLEEKSRDSGRQIKVAVEFTTRSEAWTL